MRATYKSLVSPHALLSAEDRRARVNWRYSTAEQTAVQLPYSSSAMPQLPSQHSHARPSAMLVHIRADRMCGRFIVPVA